MIDEDDLSSDLLSLFVDLVDVDWVHHLVQVVDGDSTTDVVQEADENSFLDDFDNLASDSVTRQDHVDGFNIFGFQLRNEMG